VLIIAVLTEICVIK